MSITPVVGQQLLPRDAVAYA